MARKPNYKFERLERERAKAAKKAAKAEEKHLESTADGDNANGATVADGDLPPESGQSGS